jgi:hypothetical protein
LGFSSADSLVFRKTTTWAIDSIAEADDVLVKPDMQQALALVSQAKSEVIVDGDGNSRDMASALEEVEKQIKAAAVAESQGSSAQPVVPQTGSAVPTGRQIIHRRRWSPERTRNDVTDPARSPSVRNGEMVKPPRADTKLTSSSPKRQTEQAV